MKILLIATNQAERYMDRMVVRPLPIGLAYLAAHLDETLHDLEVLDLMFSSNAVSDVGEAVGRFDPDIVGLSIRNLDNQSYLNPVFHLPGVKDIVDCVRSLGDAKVVCGGPAFSILPAECLRYLGADLGIAGDGVESFAELVKRLDEGREYSDVPGLVHWDGSEAVAQPLEMTSDFRRPPRLDLLDLRRYDRAGFGVGVVTKLAQYYYPTADGRGGYGGEDWRIRDVDEVVDEVSALHARSGIRKLFFIDSGFNIPLDHAKKLCGGLVAAGLPLRWNSYLRTGDCDEELTLLMRRSGCSLALVAGREPDGGDRAGLDDHLDGLRKIAGLCRDSELPFALNLAFGTPGESERTVNTKLDFLREVRPQFATLRVGSRVLPGTAVAESAREEGLISSDADLLEPTFYLEPGVRDWLPGRVCRAAGEPRWNAV